ncbi:hypothetical protein AO371_0496 [Moraxella catarrhalis]|nr:hypothetical protein AO371_0496 [Moraxella catarrhalis]
MGFGFFEQIGWIHCTIFGLPDPLDKQLIPSAIISLQQDSCYNF